MYPDFSYWLHAIFGTEPDNWASLIKTFGLFLVLAIFSAALLFYAELKRKENQGLLFPTKEMQIIGAPASAWDIISNALVGFFLGFKFVYIFQNYAEVNMDPASVIFSTQGNWLAGIVGALFFGGIKYFEKNKEKLPEPKSQLVDVYPSDRIGDITILAAVSGIIGAKVFALVEDLDAFFQDPFGQFFSGSGMAIYGGLIGGFVGGLIYLNRKKINAAHVFDAVAPALMISYGIGRLGCHFSGDGDWGIPVEQLSETGEVIWSFTKPALLSFTPDWLWAYDYPHNVLNQGVAIAGCEWNYCSKLPAPVIPTSIYEFVMALGIGGFLWGIRKRITIPGMLFFIYLIFNGVERYFIEKVRVNDRYEIFGFDSTQAQVIAICLVLTGIIGCLFVWQRNKSNK